MQQIRGEVPQTHDKYTQKESNKEKPLKGNMSFVNKVKYMRRMKSEAGQDDLRRSRRFMRQKTKGLSKVTEYHVV